MMQGSSPLSRGARREHHRCSDPDRIIPAFAGSTPAAPEATFRRWDHPRFRGEHSRFHDHDRSHLGSSPLSRGARAGQCDVLRAERIIPAFAGSTRRCLSLTMPGWDHPRFRGEHAIAFAKNTMNVGSSPLSRGAPPARRCTARGRRIIPAFAGSTHARRCRGRLVWDHPRFRGEHPVRTASWTPDAGSSPLSRGARRRRPARRREGGIIPAFAGSTPCCGTRRRPGRDHPRFRGEHPLSERRPPAAWGSSPLSRGARSRRAARRLPLRIIPAFAGSTPGCRGCR